jgi:hypothetical protein
VLTYDTPAGGVVVVGDSAAAIARKRCRSVDDRGVTPEVCGREEGVSGSIPTKSSDAL